MHVIYYSRYQSPGAPEWCGSCAPRQDILSIHVALNENAVGLVGEKQIKAMKRGSAIINTARGKVLDDEAVIRALEDDHLASVGLVVYPNEPFFVNSRLFEFPQEYFFLTWEPGHEIPRRSGNLRIDECEGFVSRRGRKGLVAEFR